jgi:hypothetical protein
MIFKVIGQRSRSPGPIFETIQYAFCHRKFPYMINQKFMKLCTLQDPNMKMCTLVGYPSPLRFTPVMLFWAQKVRQFTMCFVITTPPTCLMRCLCILREPNMKMCTLVVYPGSLSFSRVMPIWTWKFDTIHHALCHHNSSHMLNELFAKLSILQDPNMKMCTIVPYPGPLSFSRVMPKTMHLYILRF